MLASKSFSVVLFALTFVGTVAFAMKPKSYQISGPVVALSDRTITIEKTTGEQVVLSRDAITRTNGGEIKIGDRVSINYTMAADDIEIVSKPSSAKSAQ